MMRAVFDEEQLRRWNEDGVRDSPSRIALRTAVLFLHGVAENQYYSFSHTL